MRLQILSARQNADLASGLEAAEAEFASASERADSYLALNDTLSNLRGDMANENTQVSVEQYDRRVASTESAILIAAVVAAGAALMFGIYKLYKYIAGKKDGSSDALSKATESVPDEKTGADNLKAASGTPSYDRLLHANMALYLTKRNYICDANGLLRNFPTPSEFIKKMDSLPSYIKIALAENKSVEDILKGSGVDVNGWKTSYQTVRKVATECGMTISSDFEDSFKSNSGWFKNDLDYVKGLEKILNALRDHLQSTNENPTVQEHDLVRFMCDKESFRKSALTFKQNIEMIQSDADQVAHVAEKTHKELEGMKASIQQQSSDPQKNEAVRLYIDMIQSQAKIYKTTLAISVACNKYCEELAKAISKTSNTAD